MEQWKPLQLSSSVAQRLLVVQQRPFSQINPGQHGSLVQESGVRRHGKQNLPGGSPMVQIPVHH